MGWEDTLEEEMATHSSILDWEISWTEESAGYSPQHLEESDTTELLTHTHTISSLSVQLVEMDT